MCGSELHEPLNEYEVGFEMYVAQYRMHAYIQNAKLLKSRTTAEFRGRQP
jgi:hypothetical protein